MTKQSVVCEAASQGRPQKQPLQEGGCLIKFDV